MTRALETGELFFFYRPRVGVEEVRSLEDVQRLFMVLSPDGRQLCRRLILGRKRLPDPLLHERAWAFVAEVAQSTADVRDDLERTTYETKTRGTRVLPEARPAGEARYAIADHDGHTHFAYVLELPREPGEAQKTFDIRREASYIVAVRNPDADAPPGAGLPPRERPDYPEPLRERFRGRRFIAADPPELLDYRGAEIVLIGATDHARRELGIDLEPQHEDVERAELFRRLRIGRDELPAEPLEAGKLR